MKTSSKILLLASLIGLFFTVSSAAHADQHPHITSLDQSSGPVGTRVTITGTGFNHHSGDSNSISFQLNNSNYTLTSSESADGKHLHFFVPYYLNFHPRGVDNTVSPGQYKVQVGDSPGTSNKVTFTVTNAPPIPPPPPSCSPDFPNICLTSLDPISGTYGATVIAHGSGLSNLNFPQQNSTVSIGSGDNNRPPKFITASNSSYGAVTFRIPTSDSFKSQFPTGVAYQIAIIPFRTGVSNSLWFKLTDINTTPPAPPPPSPPPPPTPNPPTASLTVNGNSSDSVAVGSSPRYEWHSTNASEANGDQFRTTYTVRRSEGCHSPLTGGVWLYGSTANGDINGSPRPEDAGCTFDFTYTVTKASGQTVSATMTVVHEPVHRSSADASFQLASVFSAIDQTLAQKNTYGLTADVSKALDWLWRNVSEILTGKR